MKKFVITLLFLVVIALFIGGCYVYYNASLEPVVPNLKEELKNQETEDIVMTVFSINEGETLKNIFSRLSEAKLIKNEYTAYLYVKLHNGLTYQAGTYELNQGMSLEEILDKFSRGDVVIDTTTITFLEGKRITNYVKQISETFGYSEEEILNTISNKEYLRQLIDKYWFLSIDILDDNIYYPLEGYLYPDTYEFYKDATIEEIIEKMLDETSNKLNNYKMAIENSDYTLHNILTMASIVELESSTGSDRAGVAGVFYNRLKNWWSLGSDVTTYYASRVELGERDLYMSEINDINSYNTRASAMAGKLPVGPICNPGIESIIASLKPTQHNYFYFVADKNGKVYFSATGSEHTATINKLKNEGLWYTY